jgi:hypothetical protein
MEGGRKETHSLLCKFYKGETAWFTARRPRLVEEVIEGGDGTVF